MTAWDPALYARFEAERSQPFYDLAALVRARAGMAVIDLGCGSGELTAWLHRGLEAASTLGIDSSEAMLGRARAQAEPGLTFEAGDINRLESEPWGRRQYDLVFSNAALQWVTDHERLFPRLRSLVAPGGQLAVQMPANEGHISHVTAMDLAREEPYASALEGYERPLTVLSPVRYAELLHTLGFEEQSVRLQIYPHLLPGPESVVEWVSGTFLTAFRSRLSPELYAAFLEEYGRRLIAALGPARPYLYTYPRVLIWGRLAAG
ncbi:MAG TPA: methyltransferase domain-containing protein [Dehalococcoidia bacterium]|nr:methyltransferase domain-containing protein [Dehalococcoidia bacterium]